MFHSTIPTRDGEIVNHKRTQKSIRFASILAILSLFSAKGSAEVVQFFRGEVFFGKDQSKPAFLAERSAENDGKTLTRKMRFLDLQKNPLVSEILKMENQEVRNYQYNQLQMKEGGTAEIRDGKVFFHFKKEGKECQENETLEANTLAVDLFPDFLAKNWDDLLKGQTKKARLLLIERCETFGIKFFKDRERSILGIEGIDFIMKPSNFFVNLVVPNTRITLEKAPPHQLLEIEGRTTIRLPEVANPKSRKDYYAIDARVTFEKVSPKP